MGSTSALLLTERRAPKDGRLEFFACNAPEFACRETLTMRALDRSRQLFVYRFLDRKTPVGRHMLQPIGSNVLQPPAHLLTGAGFAPEFGNGPGEGRLGAEYEYCARERIHGAGV